MHRKLNKIIQEVDWPSRLAFCFFWNIKSLYFTYSHSYSLVLSLAVIVYHSLSFFVALVVICCHLLYHSLYQSLSFVVPIDVIRCHSLSFVVPLVVISCQSLSFDVTRCISRLSFYKWSLFYDFLLFASFIIKIKQDKKNI